MQVYKEKVFDAPDHMDLVHALCILHVLRGICRKHHLDDFADAIDVILGWVDDTSLLIGKIAKEKGDVYD